MIILEKRPTDGKAIQRMTAMFSLLFDVKIAADHYFWAASAGYFDPGVKV